MFWLGVNDNSQLHSATFNPHEEAIVIGIKAMVGFLLSHM